MPNRTPEHVFLRWIVFRRVIWLLFFIDSSRSEKLSEIKPPLVEHGACIDFSSHGVQLESKS